jgi:hypothetical protein
MKATVSLYRLRIALIATATSHTPREFNQEEAVQTAEKSFSALNNASRASKARAGSASSGRRPSSMTSLAIHGTWSKKTPKAKNSRRCSKTSSPTPTLARLSSTSLTTCGAPSARKSATHLLLLPHLKAALRKTRPRKESRFFYVMFSNSLR